MVGQKAPDVLQDFSFKRKMGVTTAGTLRSIGMGVLRRTRGKEDLGKRGDDMGKVQR